MKTTKTNTFGAINVINNVATQAKVSTLKGVYYTSYFFNEVGQILSAAETRPVQSEINALEAATSQDDAEKAMRLLKKVAKAAGLPEPVITAGVGKFVSSRGDKYTKGLKGLIAKDPDRAFEVLKNLPDPLGLVERTVMKLFLVYKGEVLCTNPFNKIEREDAKALLKFARMWAKHKNLTNHIGWLMKSMLVPDEHGVERAEMVLDCVEDHVKNLGFSAGAKEVYYYLFNNDFTYGPVAMGNKSLIDRFNNGFYGDRFSDEEALAAALKGATSLEIAKLVGDRLGYLVGGFGCPAELPVYNNTEKRFDGPFDGPWLVRKAEIEEEEKNLPTFDFKETYDLPTISIAVARSLGLCPTYEWAIKEGRVAEGAMGPNLKTMLEFSKRERTLFGKYCEHYNPETPIEVFKTYQKMVLDHWDEVSPDAHKIAMSISELDTLAKFPDWEYEKNIFPDGTETVITNKEFITNLLITLEELLSDPGKLFERKNKTVDPVTREVKEAEPEILSVGHLILFDEIYGFKQDKILFYEDPSDPGAGAFIDKILSGKVSYPRQEKSFDQANLSWLKAKSVFESDDAFNGDSLDESFEDDDYFNKEYEEDLLF